MCVCVCVYLVVCFSSDDNRPFMCISEKYRVT